jgi:hypothetical protein
MNGAKSETWRRGRLTDNADPIFKRLKFQKTSKRAMVLFGSLGRLQPLGELSHKISRRID